MMDTANSSPAEQSAEAADHDLGRLWQFAGQGLRSSDFTSAMVHFYRGEVARSNTWRTRLDATTNWAVITTGAAISFAFSDPSHAAAVLLINTWLVLLFLFIEARRYRYYELFSYRVRLMETNFFAGLLAPPFTPKKDWAEKVTDSLLRPTFPISLLEALGRRYRRNFAPIFLVLAASWVFKIMMHPEPVSGWQEFLERATLGVIPAWAVLAAGVVFNGALVGIGLFTVGMREATGEVFGEMPGTAIGKLWKRFRRATWEALEVDIHLPSLPFEQRKQLAYVISDEVEAIGKALLKELNRGVTMLHGTGMYTGKEHGVLLCAISSRQLVTMKEIIGTVDPGAFLIVTPVSEVRGSWFRPLEA